jgi:hypothetical protein
MSLPPVPELDQTDLEASTRDLSSLKAELDLLVELFSRETDQFDDQSPTLRKPKKFITETRHRSDRQPADPNGQAAETAELQSCLLLKINNPYLDSDEADIMHARLGIDPQAIRRFFRNQRNRYIIPLKQGFNDELEAMMAADAELDRFIREYFADIRKAPLELQSSPALQSRGQKPGPFGLQP